MTSTHRVVARGTCGPLACICVVARRSCGRLACNGVVARGTCGPLACICVVARGTCGPLACICRSWLLALALAVLGAGAARAETPGDRVVRLMDDAMTSAKDQYFEHDVVTQEPGKGKSKLVQKVWIKGKDWRLVEFTAPGDIKGMKVLVLSVSQMYIYLPAFHKIRRVASHAREQSFQGTALSQDDMSVTRYGELYEGKLVGETKTHWKIQGTRRPGKEFPYARIDFLISKQLHQPEELKYYNDKGVVLKTETRGPYDCQGKICNPKKIKMIDHMRNGLNTELTSTVWKVNTGIADSAFTPRALQRGQ